MISSDSEHIFQHNVLGEGGKLINSLISHCTDDLEIEFSFDSDWLLSYCV